MAPEKWSPGTQDTCGIDRGLDGLEESGNRIKAPRER